MTGGSGGGDMAQLQQLFAELGYRIEDSAGVHGPSTTAAVRSFQRDRRLTVDGLFGPATAAELRRVTGVINAAAQPHFHPRRRSPEGD